MNIVEKEAKQFSEKFYRGVKINNLENLKSVLTNKLYNFSRDRDKLDFLRILRQESVNQKNEHLKRGCSLGTGCSFEAERDIGIFAIDQEIDSINNYYTYQPKPEEEFSSKEESELQSRLNEIIKNLEKLGYGQEIIFEEIDSLKSHFNIGKKNWFQLLKGKLIDLTLEKVIEKTIVSSIYDTLTEGFKDVTKVIE